MSKEESRNQKINPFEWIHRVDELPPELKKKVMATIDFAHLTADLGKLFSVDMAKTAGKLIDLDSKDNAEK